MDLQIQDVAKWLNVTEETVQQWITNKQIPAHLMGNRYRFCRTEIENWMISRFPFSICAQTGKGNQLFNLFRAIHKGSILYNVPGKTKEEMIKATMKRVAPLLNVDADVMAELLLDREELMPTALNNGIAVPHTRDTLLKGPHDIIVVVFPEQPMEYGAFDGALVDILFFIFACEDKRHLHLLAKIAHLSQHSAALTFFRSHPPKEQLLAFVKDWESSLSGNSSDNKEILR